jgi:rhamnogalacturonyl hydrolase YesR
MKNIEKKLIACLRYAKLKNYAGPTQSEGLNSPAFKYIKGKWIRLGVSTIVSNSPVDSRSLLKIPVVRTPESMAIFVQAYLQLYQHTKTKGYLEEAERLLDWLSKTTRKGYHGACWAYPYHRQDSFVYTPKNTPTAKTTCTVLQSYALAYKLTKKKKYLDILSSGGVFLLKDLHTLYSSPDKLCKSESVQSLPIEILHVNAGIARILGEIYKHTANKKYKKIAKRIMNYVASKQGSLGEWSYALPASKHNNKQLNTATGYLLDNLRQYRLSTKDDSFMEVYLGGLDQYYKNLFGKQGEPKYQTDKNYPQETHASAQGIITFSRATAISPEYQEWAGHLFDWAGTHLFDPKEPRVFQHIGRASTHKLTLIDPSQSHICLALSTILVETVEQKM